MHRETGSRTFADEAVGDDLGRNERLEGIHAAIDWCRVGAVVDVLHSAREGRKAYPPLLMMKAMLLQHLHDLSDPGLEERLRNDLSWRRFVGLGLTDGTPDHTTISRFRNLVVDRGLMRRVFEAVNEHLDERGMVLRHTVVDATLVEARASRPPYRKERSGARPGAPATPTRPGVRGPSATAGTSRSTTARGWCGTPSSRRPTSTTMCDGLIQGDEEVLYADAAYETGKRTELLEEMGIGNAVMPVRTSIIRCRRSAGRGTSRSRSGGCRRKGCSGISSASWATARRVTWGWRRGRPNCFSRARSTTS